MSKFIFKRGQNVRIKDMDGKYRSGTIVDCLDKNWRLGPKYAVTIDKLKVIYVGADMLLPDSPLAGAIFE